MSEQRTLRDSLLIGLSIFVVVGLLIWCFTQALDGLISATCWLTVAVGLDAWVRGAYKVNRSPLDWVLQFPTAWLVGIPIALGVWGGLHARTA